MGISGQKKTPLIDACRRRPSANSCHCVKYAIFIVRSGMLKRQRGKHRERRFPALASLKPWERDSGDRASTTARESCSSYAISPIHVSPGWARRLIGPGLRPNRRPPVRPPSLPAYTKGESLKGSFLGLAFVISAHSGTRMSSSPSVTTRRPRVRGSAGGSSAFASKRRKERSARYDANGTLEVEVS